jgi:lysozyme
MPYLCPAGVWTCGWGSTGHDVFPGRAWTQEYADRRMEWDALAFATGTVKLCPELAGDRLCAIADWLATWLARRFNFAGGSGVEVESSLGW